MELTTTWKEVGVQIGRRKGERAEALNIARRLLVRRFGAIPPTQDAQISTLALPHLKRLIEDTLDFARLEEVQQWLSTDLPDQPDATTTI